MHFCRKVFLRVHHTKMRSKDATISLQNFFFFFAKFFGVKYAKSDKFSCLWVIKRWVSKRLWYGTFINCNWVVTRWQYTFTQTIYRTTQITTEQHKYKLMWKSAGRALSLQVLPRHLPYKWGKSTEKPQSKYSMHITKSTHTLQNPHKHSIKDLALYKVETWGDRSGWKRSWQHKRTVGHVWEQARTMNTTSR
jgi:hypothetical protein